MRARRPPPDVIHGGVRGLVAHCSSPSPARRPSLACARAPLSLTRALAHHVADEAEGVSVVVRPIGEELRRRMVGRLFSAPRRRGGLPSTSSEAAASEMRRIADRTAGTGERLPGRHPKLTRRARRKSAISLRRAPRATCGSRRECGRGGPCSVPRRSLEGAADCQGTYRGKALKN